MMNVKDVDAKGLNITSAVKEFICIVGVELFLVQNVLIVLTGMLKIVKRLINLNYKRL